MKMVKSLLLGGAAGLVAVAGAQAADLPVKAKPVEYVKVCSAYGEGFFYVPGTDTCIKIGGYVRMDYYFGQTGGSFAPAWIGATGFDNRITQGNAIFQSSYQISTDVRTQTEYGTLRAYARGGFRLASNSYTDGVILVDRAFVQLGGWTWGRTASFFDFSNGAFSFQAYEGGGNVTPFGVLLGAYTHSFGGGLSATWSIEDPTHHRNWIWDGTGSPGIATLNANGTIATLGGNPGGVNTLSWGSAGPGPSGTSAGIAYTSCGSSAIVADTSTLPTVVGCGIGDYAAAHVPDFVSQYRIDQAWGSAQFMTAVHHVNAGPYGNNALTSVGTDPTGSTYTGVSPKDKYGFAIGGGLLLNLPTGQGDKFWIEGVYTQGAPSYTGYSYMANINSSPSIARGQYGAAGFIPDAVFANFNGATTLPAGGFGTCTSSSCALFSPDFSGLQLTTAWTIGAAVEHFWTPALRTSVYGMVNVFSFNGTAAAIMCNSPGSPYTNAAGVATANGKPATAGVGVNGSFSRVAFAGCNPNWSDWGVGTRTIWNPVKNLDVGAEVLYTQLDQHLDPNLAAIKTSGVGSTPAGSYIPRNMGAWNAMIRIQRNFWP